MALLPASFDFTADGTPYSTVYGDIYHTRAGVGQVSCVFMAGNGLPQRWRGRRHFVICETGFGLGLNFLVTWAAWRADPDRSERLHFISCELHPLTRSELARLLARWPSLAELAAELLARWPTLTPGLHRLHFDDDRVTLSLFLGDAVQAFDAVQARVDAFYLDGFAPAKNPDLWTTRVFYRLSRLAVEGATIATWSVAAPVRENLRRVGFVVEKVKGFDGKRHSLQGVYRGHLYTRPDEAETVQVRLAAMRHAIVIGAGIAGSSTAARLAARGWQVEVIEQGAAPGQGASGNLAGIMHPLPSMEVGLLDRLIRAALLYGLNHLSFLQAAGDGVWGASGVLFLARDDKQLQTMEKVVKHHAPPPDYCRFVTAEEASLLAGWRVPLGGWWFASSGWARPPEVCAANLARYPEKIHFYGNRRGVRLEQRAGRWHVWDEHEKLIAAAPVLILANGVGIRDFPQAQALPVVSARGQISLLSGQRSVSPRVVVCRQGYICPSVAGWHCVGASFSVNDMETGLREEDHQENLAKLDTMLPGYAATLDETPLMGRTGFRPASPDCLPMVGAVPCVSEGWVPPKGATLAEVPRYPGLYAVSGFGVRGLVWAALMGEALAARLEGEPLPLEARLWAAIDPARYVLRACRSLRQAGQRRAVSCLSWKGSGGAYCWGVDEGNRRLMPYE